MSKRATKNIFTTSTPKKVYEDVYKAIYAGKTHRGKTFGYLDCLNLPNMKGKKLLIIATDTITNIEKNINLPEYRDLKDRIVILSDAKGNPVQITKSISYAEQAVKHAIIQAKQDPLIKAIAVDNYDNLEEMYLYAEIQSRLDKNKSGKLMSHDYGVPRSRVYQNFIRPFLVMDHINFFLVADVKEQYFDDKPTGVFDMNLPEKRRKHFSEWIWLDAKFDGSIKEEPNTIIRKWKGLRKPISLGEMNEFSKIVKEVKERANKPIT